MDSEKSTDSFNTEKKVTLLFFGLFFYPSVSNFQIFLLCAMNTFDIFNLDDSFKDFGYIVKYWNSDRIRFLVGNVYVRYILNMRIFKIQITK